MDIVTDASALMAVILDEPERAELLRLTRGHSLIAPGSIPWEMANAFSALLKRRRIAASEAQRGFSVFESIPLRIVDVDLATALAIASQANLYAYDAFLIDCAVRYQAPLLTLDDELKRAASKHGVRFLEVQS